MPRSNRPRKGKREEPEPLNLERLSMGFRRTETKAGYTYQVTPISPDRALKVYTCPGCSLSIQPGVAHLVAWRTDGIMGEHNDVADRRHWHKHCWRIG
jgi:hypothetical protein